MPARIVEPDLSRCADLRAELQAAACAKAEEVAARGVRGLIFAADTIGHVEGRVFGKPADRDEAERMLRAISGTTHEVLTGWCLLRTADGRRLAGESELAAYLDGGQWIGKSGAYGLQLPADPFVTRLDGSATNVVGVPLERLREALDRLHG
jgi:septum formation protein